MVDSAEPLERLDGAPDTQADHAGKSNHPAGESKHSALSGAATARQQVVKVLSQTDTTIERINTLLSTSGGQESVLASINYSSHALHYLLFSAPSVALRNHLRLLLRQKFNRNHAVASSESKTSSPSSSPLLALSSLMSETRYNLRLFGLIPLWAWGSAVLKAPPSDPVLRAVAFLQVFVNVVYQALENVAYLASKGIFPKSFVERRGGIDKWYIWSTRAWLGHVLLEFVRLGRETVLRKAKYAELEKAKTELDDKAALAAVLQQEETRRQEIRAFRKSLVNNLAWAPLCIHWSVEQGIGIPPSLTGFISFIAGAWGLYDRWQATAHT
ncbi:hypothetical protein DTO166G4_7991 [Paecilomyces variotii]|nr:hypothetical protein DTO164E3_708 [Paecilomyces variotii]KAJ9210434.1 hypothetical protein DTO166G4_7991 [Paecilomyces variotii]KAJ9229780.1 hypothetical protein DTO166G5_7702 [Paecilomyces variotii]KAJ9247746.1 hypothetical protein DTO207G8_7854 [Paecilomyces variotii]KAJ9255663.1 hypothetical protein DTO195F2_6170 [Paecilomyces variotii]